MSQFKRKALIDLILLIYIILSINAQNQTCQLMMCTRSDNLEAVAIINSESDVAGAEAFMASSCPGVTNITKCDIKCNGPYDSKNSSTYCIMFGKSVLKLAAIPIHLQHVIKVY
ncbi:7429_t:CDS:1 [Dentiscutata heterogama]|uniref:7429_t:CDS:1 n=1 Tax=Dentiscutata heterogama TaxID=1316150 RepID=A0ACA9L5B8_9GLOM|nr:7429_t:CDS:1 [Dentiscutata heterogama]